MNGILPTENNHLPETSLAETVDGGRRGRVQSAWTLGDHLGAWGVRLNIGRRRYRGTPG